MQHIPGRSEWLFSIQQQRETRTNDKLIITQIYNIFLCIIHTNIQKQKYPQLEICNNNLKLSHRRHDLTEV
jgi:hypothetical protein